MNAPFSHIIIGSGPWSHLARGVKEQTFVAGLMEFAMCLGDYQKEAHCGLNDESADGGSNSAATSILILAFATLFL